MIVGSMSEECNLQETIKNSVVINIFGICSETPIRRFEGGGGHLITSNWKMPSLEHDQILLILLWTSFSPII